MIHILAEDTAKFIPPLLLVVNGLSDGTKKLETEAEVQVGDTVIIANVKGYWVKDLMRIDIKFRS